MTFKLDNRLRRDTFVVSENDDRYLLLMNNAAIPWLIVVPKVTVTEWHDLPEDIFTSINAETQALAKWLKSAFTVDKINMAAIGNVVEQLHVHIVGRSKDDYCWPGVVWGTQAPATYSTEQVESIKQRIADFSTD